jgi:hypothetical protein
MKFQVNFKHVVLNISVTGPIVINECIEFMVLNLIISKQSLEGLLVKASWFGEDLGGLISF